MREGLLWYDGDGSRDLDKKVNLAAQFYRKKYGRKPNVCYVHPSVMKRSRKINGLRVAPLGSVLKNHFWVGEEKKKR
jgi:hypothetical protein